MKKGALLLLGVLTLIGILGGLSVARADVSFLAIGNPSSIRIQGKTKSLTAEKTSWSKDGKFSGTFHVPLDMLDTGISMRDKHMKEKYLETAKWPNADLVITGCPLKAGDAVCDGQLTLHGVTKPVSVSVKASDSGKTLKIAAEFGVKLSDFGIALPSFAHITVAEDVKIQVDSETAKP